MAYRGVWQDGVDRSFGQNILYVFDRESQDRGDPFTHPVWQHGQVVPSMCAMVEGQITEAVENYVAFFGGGENTTM